MRPNVVVTAASRRVALVRSLQAALGRLSPGGRVIATDIDAFSPAVHVPLRPKTKILENRKNAVFKHFNAKQFLMMNCSHYQRN